MSQESTFTHESFTLLDRRPVRVRPGFCENLITKVALESLSAGQIASLALASSSMRNSSLGAALVSKFAIDIRTIELLESVFTPPSCESLQLAPSVVISGLAHRGEFHFLDLIEQLASKPYFCKSLKSFCIRHFTQSPLEALFDDGEQWTRLDTVHVIDCNASEDEMRALCDLAPLLTTLKVSKPLDFTSEGVELICGLSGLTSLELTFCDVLVDSHVCAIATRLTNLTSLCVGGPNITDGGFKEVLGRREIVKLGIVCEKVTDQLLESVSLEMTKLTHLDLCCCEAITDAGLAHLESLTGITSLCIRGCGNITQGAVDKFIKALPNCRVVHVLEE